MILDEVVLICGLMLAEMVAGYGGHIPPGYDQKMEVCVEVGRAAEEVEEVPLGLALAVAYEESNFTKDLVSKAKAQGPLQIIPAYFCPDRNGHVLPHKRQGRLQGCDLVKDGIGALKWFLGEYGDWKEALCHYNSGTKCYASSRGYSKRVRRRWARSERQMRSVLLLSSDHVVPRKLP